jgi:hypothetical protein
MMSGGTQAKKGWEPLLYIRGSQPGGRKRLLSRVFWVKLDQWGDVIDVWGDGEAKRLGTLALHHS